MKKLIPLLCVLMTASYAMAWGFSEDFNSYPGGSTSWGGSWVTPTNNLKLDAYTCDDSLGPRTGNSALRTATAPLGASNGGAFTFSSDSYWSVEDSGYDAVFIVLSDGLATAQQVPMTTAGLANAINAIAWGHVPGGGLTDYQFFDGKNWNVIGQSSATMVSKGEDVLSGSIDAVGNWSAEVKNFNTAAAQGSGSGMLAVAGFAFSEVTIISQGNGSQVYSGVDNINLVPEPLSLALLGVGLLLLPRRRA